MKSTVQIPTSLYAYSPESGNQFQFTIDPEKSINEQLEQLRFVHGIASNAPIYCGANPFPALTDHTPTSPKEVELTAANPGTNGLPPVPLPTQFNEQLPDKSSTWLGVPITPISQELIYIYYPESSPAFMTLQWTNEVLKGFNEPMYPSTCFVYFTQYWQLLAEHQITGDTGSSFSQEITYGISEEVSETWSKQLGLSGSMKGVVGISDTFTKTLNVGVTVSQQTTNTNEFHPGNLKDGNTCGVFAVWQLVNEFVLTDNNLNPITTRTMYFGVQECQLLTNTLICPTNIYQAQFTQFKTQG